MKRARDNTNRFLDLEAVDNDENEEIDVDGEYEDGMFVILIRVSFRLIKIVRRVH